MRAEYRQRGYSSSPAFDFQADRFSDRGAVAAFRRGERQLNPGVLEYEIGAANSSSQKPVGRPVLPSWSCDVRTISIFISFSFVSVSGSSPPVTDRWKHVAYHSQGVETKDNGDHRTLLFADRRSGSTLSEFPIQVSGTLALSSVNRYSGNRRRAPVCDAQAPNSRITRLSLRNRSAALGMRNAHSMPQSRDADVFAGSDGRWPTYRAES